MNINSTNIWAITTDGYKQAVELVNTATDHIRADLEFKDFFQTRESTKILDDSGRVAVINIFGPMVNSGPAFYRDIGFTFYSDVLEELNQLEETGGIDAYIFKINSPGGSVVGLPELADRIETLSAPSFAICEEIACSAAYYLAASTTRIGATKSTIMPNVGTILVFPDTSKMWEDFGVAWEALTNEGADKKSTFHLPSITDAQRQFLQEEVNKLGQDFQARVLDNRPQFDVTLFDAAWTRGQELVDRGVIDEIIDKF